MAGAPNTVHATAIALDGRAALIRGQSGSGKSDLALRCLGLAENPLVPGKFELIADDQVELSVRKDTVFARPPAAIQGLIEVRGVGLYKFPFCKEAHVKLIVDLVPPQRIARLPDTNETTLLGDIAIPRLKLSAFEPSAPLKLAVMLTGQQRMNS